MFLNPAQVYHVIYVAFRNKKINKVYICCKKFGQRASALRAEFNLTVSLKRERSNSIGLEIVCSELGMTLLILCTYLLSCYSNIGSYSIEQASCSSSSTVLIWFGRVIIVADRTGAAVRGDGPEPRKLGDLPQD